MQVITEYDLRIWAHQLAGKQIHCNQHLLACQQVLVASRNVVALLYMQSQPSCCMRISERWYLSSDVGQHPPQFCLYIEKTHRVIVAYSPCSNSDRPRFGPHLSVKMQLFRCIVMSVLLYSRETWAVVQTHISCYPSFKWTACKASEGFPAGSCAMLIFDHVHAFSVGSQLQSKRFRWPGQT